MVINMAIIFPFSWHDFSPHPGQLRILLPAIKAVKNRPALPELVVSSSASLSESLPWVLFQLQWVLGDWIGTQAPLPGIS